MRYGLPLYSDGAGGASYIRGGWVILTPSPPLPSRTQIPDSFPYTHDQNQSCKSLVFYTQQLHRKRTWCTGAAVFEPGRKLLLYRRRRSRRTRNAASARVHREKERALPPAPQIRSKKEQYAMHALRKSKR